MSSPGKLLSYMLKNPQLKEKKGTKTQTGTSPEIRRVGSATGVWFENDRKTKRAQGNRKNELREITRRSKKEKESRHKKRPSDCEGRDPPETFG